MHVFHKKAAVTASLLAATLLMAISVPAEAGISIGGTRVIYQAKNKEATLSIKNPANSSVYLVQSWVEGNNSSRKAPFIVTPPLYRSEPGKENILRIVHTGGQTEGNKETLYWLNVKSIPATDSEAANNNTLQMVVKSRIKIFYRPADIKGDPQDAYKSLQFSRNGSHLHVSNPTGYYVTFYSLKVNGKDVKKADMVPPFGQSDYVVPMSGRVGVTWQAINDFGGITEAANTSV